MVHAYTVLCRENPGTIRYVACAGESVCRQTASRNSSAETKAQLFSVLCTWLAGWLPTASGKHIYNLFYLVT